MNAAAIQLARAFRDPLSWVSLAVDLAPLFAVIAFGWGAAPLVALYWLENVIIGGFTLLRMLGTGLAKPSFLLVCLFTMPFFTLHYGLFCFVHGIFVASIAGGGRQVEDSPSGLLEWMRNAGPHMDWFLAAIIGVSALYFVVDYIGKGEFRRTNPFAEMFPPYGRVVTLHLAILFGAFLAVISPEPLLGVLLLILIRVAFGLYLSLRRHQKRDRQLAEGVG